MINLMPPESKTATGYARHNSRLFKWTIGCLIIITVMAATVVAGVFYIDNTKTSLTRSIENTKQQIADQNLEAVSTQAESLSQGIQLIVKVLSKEVQFSKLLKQIGNLMPSGATLGDIQLSNKVNGAIDLTANAINYKAATQVQVNLADPSNDLFDGVDTISVTCTDNISGSVNSKYKCQIAVRALFKKNAAVTFLGPGVTK